MPSNETTKSGRWDDDLSVVCAWCGRRFRPPAAVIQTIEALAPSPRESPGGKLSDAACQCPHCQRPLRFNPLPATEAPKRRPLIRRLGSALRGSPFALLLEYLPFLALLYFFGSVGSLVRTLLGLDHDTLTAGQILNVLLAIALLAFASTLGKPPKSD